MKRGVRNLGHPPEGDLCRGHGVLVSTEEKKGIAQLSQELLLIKIIKRKENEETKNSRELNEVSLCSLLENNLARCVEERLEAIGSRDAFPTKRLPRRSSRNLHSHSCALQFNSPRKTLVLI